MLVAGIPRPAHGVPRNDQIAGYRPLRRGNPTNYTCQTGREHHQSARSAKHPVLLLPLGRPGGRIGWPQIPMTSIAPKFLAVSAARRSLWPVIAGGRMAACRAVHPPWPEDAPAGAEVSLPVSVLNEAVTPPTLVAGLPPVKPSFHGGKTPARR